MAAKSKKQFQCISGRGFALPTVLIAALILLTVLLSSVTAVSSIRVALNEQYYNQLTKEAAESGVAMATNCLRQNSYVPVWNNNADPARRQLTPNTDCNGNPSTASSYVLDRAGVRTSFVVGQADIGAGGYVQVTSEATGSLLRTSTGSVWRSYAQSESSVVRYLDGPQLGSGAGWKAAGHIGFFLSSSGVLYGWGDNSAQQIGDSTLGTTVNAPVIIAPPAGVAKFKKIFGAGQGASIICGLGSNDQVYCRGKPGAGEVGLMPDAPGWHRFELAAGLTAIDMSLNGIGGDSACVLASDAQAYCAGENSYGNLGYGNDNWEQVLLSSPKRFLLPATPGLTALKVLDYDLHTCVLGSDLKAYCAGLNDKGQLGRGNTTSNPWGRNSTPAAVAMPGGLSLSDIRMTYHGGFNALFFKTSLDGRIFMAGSNSLGTAADGSFSGTIYSIPRESTNGSFSKMISVGEEGNMRNAICVVARDRTQPDSGIWCSGSNKFGQLGNGVNCTDQATWQGMPNLGGETILTTMDDNVNYQMNSVMVITTAGNVWAWGDNTYGKLGTGAPLQGCNPTPAKVQLPSGVKAVALSNGDEYTSYILGDNGQIYASGRNSNGQLGDGSTDALSTTPRTVKVPRETYSF